MKEEEEEEEKKKNVTHVHLRNVACTRYTPQTCALAWMKVKKEHGGYTFSNVHRLTKKKTRTHVRDPCTHERVNERARLHEADETLSRARAVHASSKKGKEEKDEGKGAQEKPLENRPNNMNPIFSRSLS